VQVNGKNTMGTMTIFAHDESLYKKCLSYQLKLGVLTLPKADNNKPIKLKEGDKKYRKLQQILTSELNNYPMADKIWISTNITSINSPSNNSLYRYMHRFMHKYALRTMRFYSLNCLSIDGKKTIATDYFQNNRENFETVYQLLEDTKSKEHYAHYIKASITGNRGYYQKEHGFDEYFHPLVKCNTGDTIIDAGVSENIDVVVKFSSAVGDTGKVYAFEPDVVSYNSIKQKLQENNITNVTVVQSGLWSHHNELLLRVKRKGSSSLLQRNTDGKELIRIENETTQKCTVLPLSDFCKKNALVKLDIIKMDIEGAELPALLGAEEVIKKFVPTLCICLYHNQSDLIEIPLFLSRLNLGYKFYAAGHRWKNTEFVLYAIPRKK
jgi:FkbM family methyltransferase